MFSYIINEIDENERQKKSEKKSALDREFLSDLDQLTLKETIRIEKLIFRQNSIQRNLSGCPSDVRCRHVTGSDVRQVEV
jgi:hypothetical protein